MKELLLIVGQEGSGHHLLLELLKVHIKNNNLLEITRTSIGKKFTTNFMNLGNPFPFPRSINQKRTFAEKLIIKRNLINELKNFKNDKIYLDVSIPWGFNYRSVNFPFYSSLYDLLKLNYNFKLIFLRRNIIDCAKSILRRKFEKDPLKASEIALKSYFFSEYTYLYLKNEMENVIFDYDKLINKNYESLKHITKLLNLNENFFENKIKLIKKRNYDNTLSDLFIEKYLSSYSFIF